MVTGVGEGVGVGFASVSNPPVKPIAATVTTVIRRIAIITISAIFIIYLLCSRMVMSILLGYWAVNAQSSGRKRD